MGLIRPFPCVTNKRATEKQVFFPPLTKSLTIAQIGDDNFSKAYPEIPDKFTWLTTVERSGRVFPEESTCSSSERVLSRSLSSCGKCNNVGKANPTQLAPVGYIRALESTLRRRTTATSC